jgi:hypothetical protein
MKVSGVWDVQLGGGGEGAAGICIPGNCILLSLSHSQWFQLTSGIFSQHRHALASGVIEEGGNRSEEFSIYCIAIAL